MSRALIVLLLVGMTAMSPTWATQSGSNKPQKPISEELRTGGPYVPTPSDIVLQMLDFAKVSADDYVIDLGSGDGVIVLTAAHRYKAGGEGIEIDPELVQLSNDRAVRLGVAGRVSFAAKDIFKADVSRATVVTLYLLPDMMRALLPKLFRELRPGTRIVSHDYHFEDWRHIRDFTFHAPEKEGITGVPEATLYLWVAPAKVGGRWRLTVDGEPETVLDIEQTYNGFHGSAGGPDGESVELSAAQVTAVDIAFNRSSGTTHRVFRGRVEGARMEGMVDETGGPKRRWKAERY